MWAKVAQSAQSNRGHIKFGMVLSRDPMPKVGHLMQTRVAQINKQAILQLHAFERANDAKMTIFILIEAG